MHSGYLHTHKDDREWPLDYITSKCTTRRARTSEHTLLVRNEPLVLTLGFAPVALGQLLQEPPLATFDRMGVALESQTLAQLPLEW